MTAPQVELRDRREQQHAEYNSGRGRRDIGSSELEEERSYSHWCEKKLEGLRGSDAVSQSVEQGHGEKGNRERERRKGKKTKR